MNHVVGQMHHAIRKHGCPTRDYVRRAGVLTEEVGEVMKEALQMTSAKSAIHGPQSVQRDRFKAEMEQVAAYALLVLMEMQREEITQP